MDQRTLPDQVGSDFKSESLADSVEYSDSQSLVESVGSVEIESWKPEPRPIAQSTQIGTQFMHFFKELRGVPVHAAWEFIRDHKAMASLIPGITESLTYLEGHGGTGSIYVAEFSPKCARPGEDSYLINKVEVSDDASKLYAVGCIGGKYRARYHLYMTYTKVLAHDVLGDSSSIVAWRLEYEPRNPASPPPVETKNSYLTVMDLIRSRHRMINRVERPIVNQMVAKRWRLLAGQQRLTGADEKEEDRPSKERRRKSRVGTEELSDRESNGKRSQRRKASNNYQLGGSGLKFRRRSPQLQEELFIEDFTDLT